MIDIHCHILPGLDDGPADMETSLRMCLMAAEDGVSHVVATPHFRHQDSREKITGCMETLRKAVRERGISVALLEGADIRLTYELAQGIADGNVPCINGSRYFLLELPDILPPNLDLFIETARSRGFIPIITHPERNYSVLADNRKINPIRDAGALLQITAMSLTGQFGRKQKKLANALLRSGMVDFVASDAHGDTHRPPLLSKAFREVSSEFGEGMAERLFIRNPAAVIENREI